MAQVIQMLDSLESGGAQRVAINLSAWLAAQGWDVTIVSRGGVLESEVPKSVELEIPSSESAFSYYLAVKSIVRRSRGSVILHSHQRRESLIGQLVRPSSRRIVTAEHAHTRFPRVTHRRLSFRSDAIFAVSADTQAMLVNDFGIPLARVTLVENAPTFPHTAPPPTGWNPHQSAESPLRVLGVGRLTEQKNPQRFVRLVSELARHRKVCATWIGDGPLAADVQTLARSSGTPISFLPFTNRVYEYIDQSDALLMTSAWEGLPLVALEAMARGRVTIGPRISGLGTLISESRGIVYEPDSDDESVARQIASITAVEWGSIARAGQAYVAAHHSPEANHRAVAATYEALVGA